MSACLASGRPVPLGEVLSLVQQELVSLLDLSADAQLVMGYALEHAVLDPAQWHRAQSLDLITQRLAGLAAFLQALGPGLSPGWQVDPASAIGDVTLSDLAARLMQTAPAPHLSVESIELF